MAIMTRAYSSDYRRQRADEPDFLQVLVIDHDIERSNLYEAYQKVYQDGAYVGVRLTRYLHYAEIVNEDRFHFDPRELAFALEIATKHGNPTLGCFAYSLLDFKES